jgi:hypothetical protein
MKENQASKTIIINGLQKDLLGKTSVRKKK